MMHVTFLEMQGKKRTAYMQASSLIKHKIHKTHFKMQDIKNQTLAQNLKNFFFTLCRSANGSLEGLHMFSKGYLCRTGFTKLAFPKAPNIALPHIYIRFFFFECSDLY